jgi:hypothetical protein
LLACRLDNKWRGNIEMKSKIRGLKIAFTSLTPLVCQSELGNEIASSCRNDKETL